MCIRDRLPDLRETEEARAAFDGMRRAEHAVYQLFVDPRTAPLNGQQIRFDGPEVLAAFRQIVLDLSLIHI